MSLKQNVIDEGTQRFRRHPVAAMVLGRIGRNFAAGMSGGLAYVFDPKNVFWKCCNPAMVTMERLSDPEERKRVQALIYAHLENTESPRADEILRHWDEMVKQFWRVVPHQPKTKPADKPAAVSMNGRSKSAIVDGVENGVAQSEFRTRQIS